MFFSKRKRYVRNESKFFYWMITAFVLSLGMLAGFFAFEFGDGSFWNQTKENENIFTYSFVKNCIFATFLFINAFSFAGFPITLMLVFFAGYIQAVSVFYIFASKMSFSFGSLLRIIPHSALSLYMVMFLSVGVMHYSKKMFCSFVTGRGRFMMGKDTFNLFLSYAFAIFLSTIIALYESNFI